VIGDKRVARLAWPLAAVALIYALLRFAVGGVQFPLVQPNLGQVEEELTPLRDHLTTGAPVHTNNPRQYGATFLLVLHPLVTTVGDDPVALSRWLYAIEIGCLAIAFVATCATLRRWVVPDAPQWALAVLCMLVLWLTSTPLYAILAVKNVEIWELALITVALYCYLRRWLWATAFAVAAAGLAKLLPLLFVYYFLLRDHRAFVRTCAAIAVILALAHALYGPRMGVMYLPSVLTSSVGETWALNWHENNSIKGIVAKLLGDLLNPQHMTSEQLAAIKGPVGHRVALDGWRAPAAALLGTAAQLLSLALLTWACVRGWHTPLSAKRTVWEWSLVAVGMLIISPNTAFEYTVLALGASSYVLIRLIAEPAARARRRLWATYLTSALLLGALLPRSALNKVTLVEVITQFTNYDHLSPSEQYQYYGFPFLGLCLLIASLWMLRVDELTSTDAGAQRATAGEDGRPHGRPPAASRR
jgi:hypothetical protein